VTEKMLLSFPMEYVEAYASRAGFVLLRDGKILWVHWVRFHPMLQHVTRSWDGISQNKQMAMSVMRLN
jgi:hypothetical protein